MCLSIPKKVIAVYPSKIVEIEDAQKSRQKVIAMVDLEVGDYCLTQQGYATQRVSPHEAELVLKEFGKLGMGKEK